ncbi:MAG: ATP-binding protein [Candidatus Omnitrophota bacterium]
MNLQGVLSYFTAFTSLILGTVVLLKDRKQTLNITWFLMSVCISIWAGLYAFMITASNYNLALFSARVLNYSAMFIAPFYLHFIASLLNKNREYKSFVISSYFALGALLIVTLIFPNYFVPDVMPKFGFKFYTKAGFLFYPYFILWAFYITYAFIKLIFESGKYNDFKRNQIQYIIFASLIGFPAGTTSFLAVLTKNISPFGVPFISLYTFIISYAIIKHHLMDINVVIRRSLVYSILAAFITVIYLIFVILAERLLHTFVGYSSLVPTILAAFTIAILFIPLKNKIQAFVDRVFFKGTLVTLSQDKERLEQEVRQGEKLAAIGRLAAGIAHEIKNPLTSIKTFTEFLNEKFDEPDFRDKFKRIVGEEVDRINHIVNSLLDLSRPKPLNLESVDVPEIIENILNLLEPDLSQARITIKKDFQDNLSQIPADPNQLKQAFINLILNAKDAMKDSLQKELTIKTRKVSNFLQIEIIDTGCGIPQDKLNSIFEPFYSTKEKGTGLGLSIVHSIIQAHHGKIEVKSTPAVGTTFIVSLPFRP